MTDEKIQSRESEEGTTSSSKEGEAEGETSEGKTESTLDRAERIVQMQKRENDRSEKILKEQQDLHARKAVGGVTEAGSQPLEKTPEEKKEQVFKGFAEGRSK